VVFFILDFGEEGSNPIKVPDVPWEWEVKITRWVVYVERPFTHECGQYPIIDQELRQKILRLLGPNVCRIYQISMAGGW